MSTLFAPPTTTKITKYNTIEQDGATYLLIKNDESIRVINVVKPTLLNQPPYWYCHASGLLFTDKLGHIKYKKRIGYCTSRDNIDFNDSETIAQIL